ncbi:TetR/AcrR family transcriptional regulator [Streptomyces sp. 4N509B]|uniref:TetR/AcrR family transcriptional regulator n=1 Tax=Streptomyces sp. 4N509B TaxID=3457413 RepID=UPI003FD3593C
MPTAREVLLEAAREAVEHRPWPVVRMVEVAAAAGVSRQTLYNEFGDKAGLGAALVERQVARFLDGFTAGLSSLADDAPVRADDAGGEERLALAADWMAAWLLRAARRDRLVRATLTGCHSADLPPCPGQPGALVAELRDRALSVLAPPARAGDAPGDVTGATPGGGDGSGEELAGRCETTIRLALSHIVAPAPGGPAAGRVVPPRAGWHAPAPSAVAAAPARAAAQSPSRRSRVASSRRSE